jgi:hypothetical protein
LYCTRKFVHSATLRLRAKLRTNHRDICVADPDEAQTAANDCLSGSGAAVVADE